VTYFYLIRHAANDLMGHTIAGWTPGVHLNAEGEKQALRLAEHLRDSGIQHLFTSPLERTRETAAPIAKMLGLEARVAKEIGEIRFGKWTGRRFDELAPEPEWQQWNAFRSGARPPDGESYLEVQARCVGLVQRLAGEVPGSSIALVSHGDPIRSVLLFYLGMPLDFVHRLEIGPASVSILALGDTGAQLMSLNRQVRND
jgi:broad specificity phosphatase PhoE